MFRNLTSHPADWYQSARRWRSILVAVAGSATLAAAVAAPVNADEPVRTNPPPKNVGAPYYLHMGPWGGLCTRAWNDSVDDRGIDLINGVLYIKGDRKVETSVDISVDDQGTTTEWDDELVVDLTVYADGPDVTVTFSTPYWLPNESVDLNTWATANTPQVRSVGLVRYSGSTDIKNAVDNNTSLPAYATGWFGLLASGDDGYDGGGGPECVRGSNEDDRISTRGGSDYVMGRHGNDLIALGKGNDTAEGGSDDDTLRGGGGWDKLIGGEGDDCYDGGSGNDLLDEGTAGSVNEFNEYEIDDVGDDWITQGWPNMVDACM